MKVLLMLVTVSSLSFGWCNMSDPNYYQCSEMERQQKHQLEEMQKQTQLMEQQLQLQKQQQGFGNFGSYPSNNPWRR